MYIKLIQMREKKEDEPVQVVSENSNKNISCNISNSLNYQLCNFIGALNYSTLAFNMLLQSYTNNCFNIKN